MNHIKILILLLFCFGNTIVFAQKAQFKKADKAYKAQNYSEAIPLYEEGLAIKDNLSRKTKLANSYRMINQLDKAATLFREVVRDPKAKPITYFYLGEALMGAGNYDEAKYWFQQYHIKEPDDQKALLMIAACNQVKDINSVFPDIGVLPFAHNSDVDDSAPIFWNNQILFSSDRNQGIKLLKQKSGVTGRDYIQVYSSAEGSNFNYANPKSYSGKVNELNKNSSNITISQDGTRAVFSRNSKNANKKNTHTMQLFAMESTDGKKWKNVKEVDFSNNAYNFMHPALSPDGNSLFFVSDKGSGQGGTDIYVSYYKKNKWSRPINLGPVINTDANEGFPFFDKDEKLFFCSKGHAGLGGFDIFFSIQNTDTEQWDVPINVGTPINSPSDDISIFIDHESRRALFTSSRDGGDDDIYLCWLDGLPNELKETEITAPDPQPEIAETVIETEPIIETETIIETPTVDPIVSIPAKIEMEIEPVPIEIPVEIPVEIVPEPSTEILKIKETVEVEMKVETPEKIVEIPTSIPEEIFPESTVTKEISQTIKESDIELPTTPRVELISLSIDEEIPEEDLRSSPPIIPNNSPATEVVTEISVETPPATTPVPEPITVEPTPTTPLSTTEITKKVIKEEIEKELPVIEKPAIPNPSTPPPPSPAVQELPPPPVPTTENNPKGTSVSAITKERSSFSRLKKDLKKKRSTAGKIYRLKNISYDPGGYLVAKAHGPALDEVVKLMKQNQKITIELASHTYCIGNDQTNLKLSQNRAKRAANYLIEKGVSADRIFAVGYGEEQVLNHCTNGIVCTQAQHTTNERLEIQIMDEAH